MTTDITELAQREKFEAWWEREYKHLESSKYTDTVPHIKYGFWAAYQAGGSELVEALEKAQQRIDELLPSNRNMLMPALGGLSRDHLVVTIQTVVDNYSALHTKWLEDRQRIAELESRTVKLPDFRHEHFNSNWGEHDAEAYQVALREALTADGIKWEAE